MNNKQTKSFKPSGRLNSIFLWPVGLGILLVLLDILLCFVSSVAASIVAVFIVIYAFVCAMMICYFRPRIIKGDSGIFFQLFSGTKTTAV